MKIQTSNQSPLQDISRLISSFKFIKKLSTFYSQLSTPNFPLTTFHFQLTTFHLPLTTFYFSLFTIIYSPFTISAQRSLATLEDDMVLVEGGSFIMGGLPGRDDKNGLSIGPSEQPVHKVNLFNFYISKYEVTQQLWQEVMGYNPSIFSSCGQLCPVENISWYECITFCNKLSIIQGKMPVYTINKIYDFENGNTSDKIKWQVIWNIIADGYRLPCESEWEFAARGGNKSLSYQFSGSNDINEVAWFILNSNNTTHQIGMKKGNEIEIYDMSGNVFEFCFDQRTFYGSDWFICSEGNGNSRFPKGGAFNLDTLLCRISNRSYYIINPNHGYSYIGLRLVKNQPS